jgi:hydrogenase-4 component F
MGAGVFTVKYGTKQVSAMRGGLWLLPWSGPLFLLAVLALSALPPSGIFRSEFQIVAGGLGSGSYAAAAILIVLVTMAFFGLTTSATSMLLTNAPNAPNAPNAATAGRPAQARGQAAAVADPPAGRVGAVVLAAPQAGQVLVRGEPSAWMVVPSLAGVAVLFLLGLHPPGELTDLITRGVAQLGGTP